MNLIIDSLFGSIHNVALTILITSGVGILFIGSAFIFGTRDYKEVSGKFYVRHGKLGHWEEISEHMSKEHKE